MKGLTEFIRSTRPGAVGAIIGAPRTGKTRALQAAFRSGVSPRHVVYDPYARIDRLEKKHGAAVSPWPGTLVTPGDLMRKPELLDREPLELVVCPERDLDPEEHGEQFSKVARLVWATRGIDLVAEECGLYSRACNSLVLKLASGGGHVRMRLFLICQSLGRIHKDGRRHISHVIAFAQGEPTDLHDLKKRCGERFSSDVAALQPGMEPCTWSLGANLTGEARQ